MLYIFEIIFIYKYIYINKYLYIYIYMWFSVGQPPQWGWVLGLASHGSHPPVACGSEVFGILVMGCQSCFLWLPPPCGLWWWGVWDVGDGW